MEQQAIKDPFDSFFSTEVCASSVATEILNLIIDNGAQEIYNQYLMTRAVPFSAKMATSAMMSVIDICFMGHEVGEDNPSDWDLEPEPSPIPLDTWARGVVPTRKRITIDDPDSRIMSAAKTTASRLVSTTEYMQNIPFHQKISAEPKSLPSPAATDPKEDALREEKEREIRRRRDEELRAKKKQQADEDIAAQQAILRQSRKDRECNYDSAGNVILVQRPVPSSLPPVITPADFKIKHQPTLAEKAAAAAAEEAAKNDSKKKKLPSVHVPSGTAGKSTSAAPINSAFQLPPHINAFVKKLIAQQGPILECIDLSAGVSVKENGRSRDGPEPSHMSKNGVVDSTTLSREAYEKMLLSLAGGNSGSSALGSLEESFGAFLGNAATQHQSSISFVNENSALEGGNSNGGVQSKEHSNKKKNNLLLQAEDSDSLAQLLSTDEIAHNESEIEIDGLLNPKMNDNKSNKTLLLTPTSRNEMIAKQLASPKAREHWGTPVPPTEVQSQPPRPSLPPNALLGSPESRRARARIVTNNAIQAAHGILAGRHGTSIAPSATLSSAGAAALKVGGPKVTITKPRLAPPPYGATMGHGLVESEKDKYYYPSVDALISEQKEASSLALNNLNPRSPKARTLSVGGTTTGITLDGGSRVTHVDSASRKRL